eukprot:364709-Chlamydomonas_euryale.AAC.10
MYWPCASRLSCSCRWACEAERHATANRSAARWYHDRGCRVGVHGRAGDTTRLELAPGLCTVL